MIGIRQQVLAHCQGLDHRFLPEIPPHPQLDPPRRINPGQSQPIRPDQAVDQRLPRRSQLVWRLELSELFRYIMRLFC